MCECPWQHWGLTLSTTRRRDVRCQGRLRQRFVCRRNAVGDRVVNKGLSATLAANSLHLSCGGLVSDLHLSCGGLVSDLHLSCGGWVSDCRVMGRGCGAYRICARGFRGRIRHPFPHRQERIAVVSCALRTRHFWRQSAPTSSQVSHSPSHSLRLTIS